MGSQRVGHDWATELNWSELSYLSASFRHLWASHLWPAGGHSSILSISPFNDCKGVLSGQAGERNSEDSELPGFLIFQISWTESHYDFLSGSSLCPSSDSTSFTESEATEGQIVPEWGTPEESISFMASAHFIPQLSYQLLKPEHICGKIDYFLGI